MPGLLVNQPRRSRPLPLLPLLLIGAVLWAALGSTLVSTNTLGAGERFDHLVDRVRLALDPPPDRETLPTIEVLDTVAEPESSAGAQVDEEEAEPTPRPRRRPVDVRLRANPGRMFASQHTNDWCAVAGTQIVLAMHGVLDNSVATQRRIAGRIDEWEAWRDSKNGGWGPAAIAQALAAYGVNGYEIRSYRRRDVALRDSAIALSRTRAPVVLIAWRGAHTWVMTGFRADADPTIFRDAEIRGTYVYDPWYPRVSTIWGPSDRPGTYQNMAEMERNFLRWERPEGKYPDRDGKYIAVVPTIPLREQSRDRG
jgi:hypothetical protein